MIHSNLPLVARWFEATAYYALQMHLRLLVVAVVSFGLVVPAAAEDVIPGHHSNPVDGGVIGLGLGVGLAFSLLPMRDGGPWTTELFGDADLAVRDNFSRRAAHISDGLLAASLVAPIGYLTGGTIEDADGDRLMIYGESLAINIALVQAAKHLVQRPRPYLYARSAAATRYAAAQGDDARMSFYSGHAALSFGAAVTGAYLLGASTDNRTARSFAWGLGLAAATATANLRVRAGKHFYSDVVIGGLVGITVGYVVPALHADGKPYLPTGEEIMLAMGGILGGMLVSQLLPLERLQSELAASNSVLSHLQLAPVPMANGLGFAVGGAM